MNKICLVEKNEEGIYVMRLVMVVCDMHRTGGR